MQPPTAARNVIRYLREHPNASDTAEGMRRWWFADDDVVTQMQMDEALDWLVQRGLIEAIAAADGRMRFRRSASDAEIDTVLPPQPRG